MNTKAVALGAVLVIAATGKKPDDGRTVELNGGLEAQILALGRNSKGVRARLTVSMKIANKGKDHAFLPLHACLR
jgi:hypothetical protein